MHIARNARSLENKKIIEDLRTQPKFLSIKSIPNILTFITTTNINNNLNCLDIVDNNKKIINLQLL